ncbi:MAG: hypothetical protein Q9207_002601 [Kuettlingeria erythrocarpa]
MKLRMERLGTEGLPASLGEVEGDSLKPPKKRDLPLSDSEATNVVPQQSKKAKKDTGVDTEDAGDAAEPGRSSRSKNFRVPNKKAAERGKASAVAQGNKTAKGKKLTVEKFIPMVDENDEDHERVVFVDDQTGQPIFMLYRTTEAAEPMSELWQEYLKMFATAKDLIGAGISEGVLSQEEFDAIQLKNNFRHFPALITSKGYLRSKDNYEASTKMAGRNEGGTFASTPSTSTATKKGSLLTRATAMRDKATALIKQADAYEKAAKQIPEDDTSILLESETEQHGMDYLGEVLKYSKKEFARFIAAHEDHLIALSEKLRSDMAGIAAFVHRAEKRLRDQVASKVAADLKILRDLKTYGKFEVKAWQMQTLPTGGKLLPCDEHGRPLSMTPIGTPYTQLRYPDISGLPQPDPKDALPAIKFEEGELDFLSEQPELEDAQPPAPRPCQRANLLPQPKEKGRR